MMKVGVLVFALALLVCASVAAEFDYIVERGDSMATIARRVYGSRTFAGTIAEYNLIENQSVIREGQVLSLPPLRVLVKSMGDDPEERSGALDLIASAHEEYFSQSREIRRAFRSARASASGSDGVVQISLNEFTQKRLRLSADFLGKLELELERMENENGEVWSATMGQARSARQLIERIASGKCDENSYDLDMVYQRLCIAMRNLMYE
jgi:hypothetical protein